MSKSPEIDAISADAGHDAQTFGLGVELRMAKEPAELKGRFARFSIKPDQALGRMTEALFEEILVLSEQRRAFETMEQRDDV